MEYLVSHSRHVVCKLSQHDVQYMWSIWLNSQQFSQIWAVWNNVSLHAVLSHFHHCGRMAIYSNIPNIGVNSNTIITDKNWNQKDELRALASLITQMSAAIRIKKITMALHSRISFWNIVEKNHSLGENIFPFHSIILIAAWANCPVSIISQKI